MIFDGRGLASTAQCGAPNPFLNSNVVQVSRKSHRQSLTRPRMMSTTVGGDTMSATELSWKPPWEARRETSGALAGGGYDTAAMDRYFLARPEKALARLAQVTTEKVMRVS